MTLKRIISRAVTIAAASAVLALAAAPARADPPDRVRFGVQIELGNLDAARQWLDAGLDPDFMADRIGSGLMIGAWEGNVAMMELFLGRGAHVDAVNGLGEQALQLAAWNGHLDAVKWLIDHGASLSRAGREWSALHYAVFAGRKDVVELLVARGADVNGRAPNGSTVLMMAAREGHEDLTKRLLAAGADPRASNDAGETALTWAMRNKNFHIAELVATPVEFAKAAQAPPASFGVPLRSLPAPLEVSELLRQLRVAEAEGRPSDALRQQFLDAVATFRSESKVLPLGSERPTRRAAPSALVITAKRQQAGAERAELRYDGEPRDVATIMAEIRRAAAAGQPVGALRSELFEAVERFKQGGSSGPARN